MNTSDRPLIVTAVVVALLVVAAIVVVVVRPTTDRLDPASPEGVVQTYIEALLEGDEEAAAARLLDPEEECVRGPFLEDDRSFRVTLSSVEVDEDRARVSLVVTTSGGEPPFDRYEYSDEATFTLERTGTGWLIDDVPWRFRTCPEPAP